MKARGNGSLDRLLAGAMLWGVLLAAAILLGGGAVYLWHHGMGPTRDHVFSGEPHDLRNPGDMLRAAFHDNTLALIQLGVFLLLLNPLLRVLLAFFSFSAQGNRLYAGVSLFLLAILAYSLLVF